MIDGPIHHFKSLHFVYYNNYYVIAYKAYTDKVLVWCTCIYLGFTKKRRKARLGNGGGGMGGHSVVCFVWIQGLHVYGILYPSFVYRTAVFLFVYIPSWKDTTKVSPHHRMICDGRAYLQCDIVFKSSRTHRGFFSICLVMWNLL